MLPTISTFDVNRVGNFLFLQKHFGNNNKTFNPEYNGGLNLSINKINNKGKCPI